MTVVLRAVGLGILKVRVISCRYRHPVTNGVATDDEAASMDTRSADSTLKHLGILDGITQRDIVAGLSIPKLFCTFDGIGQIHLHTLRQAVRNSLAECIGNGNRNLLHTCHILNGVLGGHRGIGNDMGTILMTVFILYPFQHSSTSVIIEVGINIRQRDTVWIEETLKQQVVFQRVDLGDAQTVSHYGTCCRTTSWSHHDIQFITCGVDEVLHYQEVTWETHRFHDVQLKAHTVVHFLGNRLAITFLCSVIG